MFSQPLMFVNIASIGAVHLLWTNGISRKQRPTGWHDYISCIV